MPTQPVAALYLRSVCANDAAIEEQRRLCIDYAERRGWRIGETIADNGASGIQDRPGLATLRACIAEGRAQIVLAAGPDRIARDLQMIKDFSNFCAAHGTEIEFTNGASLDFAAILEQSFEAIMRLRERETEIEVKP